MKKAYIVIIIIAFFLLFFLILNYNLQKNGNTINSKEKIVENFLENPIKYKAQIEVEIESNKNKSKYKINQEEKENYSKQEIIEGENIEGLVIELKENTLIVSNTKLKLEKIYKNYKEISNNYLFLTTFRKECNDLNNKIEIEQTDKEYIIKLKLSNDLYIKSKQLYVDIKTGKPTRMDINYCYHKCKTSIIYTNIELN